MEVIEKKNEGLSHEFTIIVPPEDIEAKTNAKLQDLAGEVTIPGFRPGKVPPSVIRQRYGQAVRGEVLEIVVGEAMAHALSERNLQPAMQPKVEVQKFEEGSELEFTLAVDVLPTIDPVDFKTVEVERMKVAVDDAQVDKSIKEMANQMAQSEPIKGKRKSKKGDIVVIDFEGKVDGELFEGGAAKDQADKDDATPLYIASEIGHWKWLGSPAMEVLLGTRRITTTRRRPTPRP